MTGCVAVGDSYLSGTEMENRDDVWLARAMQRWLPQLEVTWLARSGSTSRDVLLEQMPALDLLDMTFALAVVTCGANDVLRRITLDLPALEHNLAVIHDAVSDHADEIVLITYPNFSPFLPHRPLSRARISDGLRQVNEVIRNTSDRCGAHCVDVESRLEQHAALFAPDGIHLSAAGHCRTADAFIASAGSLPADEPLMPPLDQWW